MIPSRDQKRHRSHNNNTILRLFPYLENKEDGSRLLIDDESIHYISVREYAEKISGIIKSHLSDLKINQKNAVILDTMAGVGGNTISFAKHFGVVISVEINKLRSEYLENNIKIYNCANVTVLNDDCVEVIKKKEKNDLQQCDVIFIDPPWQSGDISYKNFQSLRLSVSPTVTVEQFCRLIMESDRSPKLIVLKLPKNYDICNFYKKIHDKVIYFYDLNKMNILVVIV